MDIIGMLMTTVIVFIGIPIVLGILAAIGYGVILWMYPYRFSYRPIYGDITISADESLPIEKRVVIGAGGITFGKRKWIRMGPTKEASEWKVLWTKKRIPPMPIRAILEGRQLDGYKLPGGHFIPATHDIKRHLDEIVAHMNAIMPEAKSHAINELEQYARKYDTRTQTDKFKVLMAWVLAGLVCLGMIGVSGYFSWKTVSYGMDKGTESATKGQAVSTEMAATIAQTVCGIQRNNTPVTPQPSLPFNILGVGGIPQ